MGNIFEKEYAKLNPAQKEAVDSIEGPVMVIAGPGTGKTQIMAMRIANILIRAQANPANILALTFTESGVYAIKKRLLSIIGPLSYQIKVHTFHSFCNEIILNFPENFLFAKSLNQLTDLEQILIIQKIIKKLKLNLLKPFKSPFHYQNAILKAINDLKQEGIYPADFTKIIKKQLDNFDAHKDYYHIKGPYRGRMKSEFIEQKKQLEKDLELAEIYHSYENELKSNGQYDYADMILLVLDALKNDSALLSCYQEKYQYILVDEYQDTNSAQNEVVTILSSFYDNPNLFVVGDDEQSIFRFQGAALENILYFKKLYPNAKMIILKNNYRSGQDILDLSRELIAHNKNQIFNRLKIEKKLKSQLEFKGKIFLAKFSHGQVENYFIARKVKELHQKGIGFAEIAVLYRQHSDVNDLVSILGKMDIPYRMETGLNVLDDHEINKLIKFMRILDLSPENKKELSLVLFEILHYPFFKIPTVDIYKMSRAASNFKLPLLDLIIGDDILDKLDLKNKKNILNFRQLILNCAEFSYNHTFNQAFEFIINKTGYLAYLLKLPDGAYHLNRLDSLYDEIKRLNIKNKELSVRSFIEYLEKIKENNIIIKEKEIEADFDGVRLMTAHKAKGLEFTTVFLMHLTDRHWGNRQMRELIKLPAGLLKLEKNANEEDEEERRLFYVAVTRAKKEIYLSYAEKYTDDENSMSLPSKFLEEIPLKLTRPIETSLFEKNFSQRLKSIFDQNKWRIELTVKDYLREILKEFYLSPTTLNSFLECPKKFLFNNLLRVPKAKTIHQAYGTAVHRAMELFYRQYIKTLELPLKKALTDYYQNALIEEILDENDFSEALKKGTEVLEKYYEFYKADLKKGPPVNVEYNFSPHEVHFGTIPITGKIDKIELIDKVSRQVKITDYKTSQPKSLNQILGLTKDSDGSLLYQAYFYKLLAETDPLFNWQIKEIEFEFLEPRNERFVKVTVPIEQKNYDEFKELVKKIYNDISKLKFDQNPKSCRKYDQCEYFDTCF